MSDKHEVIGLAQDTNLNWYVEVSMPDYYSESSDVDFHSYGLGVVWFRKLGSCDRIQSSIGIPLDKTKHDELYPYDEYGGI